ncbi:MAG: 4-hydroxy-tetrahydrodipicolinate reductase, partial [bacterium]|nr:4-hydroxy-tetrahydrodipicolinate reductase [bacterium]
MATRVVVAGAAGRMGCRIIHQIAAAENMTLTGALERAGHSALGTDAGQNAGAAPAGVPLTADPETLAGDVIISFAIPAASLAHARLAAEKGMAAVIGTTGFSEKERAELDALGGKLACVFAPNMSVGVNVTFRLIEEAARLLGEDYDVEVLEAHHNQKIDAPSG